MIPASSGPVLYWRLRYLDGTYATESPDSAYQSIRWARPGAIALQLVTDPRTPHGQGVREVPLRTGERPIFYRKRSVDVVTDGSSGEKRCDAVVYGRGRPNEHGGETQLWCVLRGRAGYEHAVPRRALDTTMIALQVEA